MRESSLIAERSIATFFLIVCLTFRSSDVCYIHRFSYTITSYQTNMQNTSKAIWIKLFSIADILSNTSFSLLDTKYMFNFGQSTIIQFFIECPKALPYMNDLLIVTGLSSSALSQTVDSLVDAGYLKRVYSEEYKNRVYVQATDSFMELRSKPLRFFVMMEEAFRKNDGSGITPKEFDIAGDILLRLAKSRTGGELAAMREESDLEMPGLISNASRGVCELPVWILILHFTTNLARPTLLYYYGNGQKHRSSRSKLRFLTYILDESYRGKAAPTIHALARRFHCKNSFAAQTVRPLIRDDLVKVDETMHVRLTQKGLLLRNRTSESYTKFMENFFAGIEPEKTAIFIRVLDAMIGFLQENGKNSE